MPTHLTRAIEAFCLLILATIVIAGILSTHSSPPVQVVANATSASTAAADNLNLSVEASDAAAQLSAASWKDWCLTGGPQCCTEPVECMETASAIPSVFAVIAVPALTFSNPGPTGPPALDDRGAAIQRAPSLILLSISRT